MIPRATYFRRDDWLNGNRHHSSSKKFRIIDIHWSLIILISLCTDHQFDLRNFPLTWGCAISLVICRAPSWKIVRSFCWTWLPIVALWRTSNWYFVVNTIVLYERSSSRISITFVILLQKENTSKRKYINDDKHQLLHIYKYTPKSIWHMYI